MITNFEDITYPLTDQEKKLVKIMINGLKKRIGIGPVKAYEIIEIINDKYPDIKFSGPRLRKLTNLIRSLSILPLIATSKGYYVSYDQDTIKSQIKSLEERADAILNSAKGLKKFIKDEEG